MLLETLFVSDVLALSYLINEKVNNKSLNDFQLRIGYKDLKVFHKPIVIDMKKTAHLFVCGLSGSGKTKMIEYALKNKNIVLLNAFEDDFKSLNCNRRYFGNDNILKFLISFSNVIKKRTKYSAPLYLVIDELLVLCSDKNITKFIADLLAIGRHYNVYLIGISQIGTKEVVKFKDLFNSRVCFRQVEESSYRAVLGYTPEYKNLRSREFYLYSTAIERGYTYTIN